MLQTRGMTRVGGFLPLGGGRLTGPLGIGIASTGPYLHIRGVSDATSYIRIEDSGGTVGAIYGASGTGGFGGVITNHPFAFRTNNTDRFSIAAAGTTSFVPNGTTTQLQVDHNAAASTCGLLVSVAGGALQRVTVGANDSGGVGFRYLRIPN